jgi:hypothetical protein
MAISSKMDKSISISFRVTPRMKLLMEAAAVNEHRSLTNLLETLVETYCRDKGIEVSDITTRKRVAKKGVIADDRVARDKNPRY